MNLINLIYIRVQNQNINYEVFDKWKLFLQNHGWFEYECATSNVCLSVKANQLFTSSFNNNKKKKPEIKQKKKQQHKKRIDLI